jgi:hypothetical protein
MKALDLIVGSAGALALIVAACLWLYASLIAVPNNIDTIVRELQRIGWWNALAAWAAVIGALSGAYLFARQINWM